MKVKDASRVPFSSDGALLDYGEQPHTVQRRCTDCPCCLLFLVALAAFGYVLLFAAANGDPDRFLGLPNTEGQFCGVSEGVRDKPLLYFCAGVDLQASVDLRAGVDIKKASLVSICVSTCPNPVDVAGLQSDCPGMAADYRSRPVGRLLCVPQDTAVATQIAQALQTPSLMWLREVGGIFRNWELLIISAAVAVVLGFVYLFILEECACCIVWSGVATVVSTAMAFGVYLVHSSQRGGADSLPGTGDSTWDFALGVGLCTFGLCLACLACCHADSTGAAITCIQDASACIGDMRTLLFQPLIEVLCKSLLLLALCVGFVYLASCMQFAPKEGGGSLYEIEFDPEDYAFFAFYAFMSLWLLQICGAYSQFVISYTAQLWFFAERSRSRSYVGMPFCPMLQSYAVGLFYHLGTFANGSFVLGIVRLPRDIMVLVGADNQNNPVTACCSCCCACILELFNRVLKFMTRNAYVDTALNSNDFCKAAYHSGMVLAHYSSEVATVNVATVIFQIAGFGGIAAAGGALTHVLCKRVERYSHESSPHYVEYPFLLDCVAAVLSALVAWPFMVLLDQVSDTLVFCSAVEKMRTPPPALEEDSEEEEGGCFCLPSRPSRNASRGVSRPDPETQALLRRG